MSKCPECGLENGFHQKRCSLVGGNPYLVLHDLCNKRITELEAKIETMDINAGSRISNLAKQNAELTAALAQIKAQSAFDKIEIEHQIASVKGLEAALAALKSERDVMSEAMVSIGELTGITSILQLSAISENDEETSAELLVKAVKQALAASREECELLRSQYAEAYGAYLGAHGANSELSADVEALKAGLKQIQFSPCEDSCEMDGHPETDEDDEHNRMCCVCGMHECRGCLTGCWLAALLGGSHGH
jgi:hypothetical protein